MGEACKDFVVVNANGGVVDESPEDIFPINPERFAEIPLDVLQLAVSILQEFNHSMVSEEELLLDLFLKAFKIVDNKTLHEKELNKLKYNLQRALFDYRQMVKNNVDENDPWFLFIQKEIKETFIEFVSLLNEKFDVNHDEFVASVHDSEIFQDYARILNIDFKFKTVRIIGAREIRAAASELTGLPPSWLTTSPEERLVNLKERLRKRIIRQDGAIDSFVDILTAAPQRQQLFLFAGRPGSGKAELAKATALELYDDEDRLIRIDMTKYHHSIHDFLDTLIQTVKDHPYSVILLVLDKLDETYNDVIEALLCLQRTRIVDFSKTMMIMTLDVDDDQVKLVKFENTIKFKSGFAWLWHKMRISLREWANELTQKFNREIILVASEAGLSSILEVTEGGSKSRIEKDLYPIIYLTLEFSDHENIGIYIDGDEVIGLPILETKTQEPDFSFGWI